MDFPSLGADLPEPPIPKQAPPEPANSLAEPLLPERKPPPTSSQATGDVQAASSRIVEEKTELCARAADYLTTLKQSGLFSGYVMVTMGDETLQECSMGKDNFTRETLFNSCSSGKMLTSLALHQLFDQEGLSIQTPLAAHLTARDFQEITGTNEDASRIQEWLEKTSVEQLLNHTSGLEPASSEHLFELNPGRTFSYSNLGYRLLGKIIENHAKVPFVDYIQKNILPACGMDQALAYRLTGDEKSLPPQSRQFPSGKIQQEDRHHSTPGPVASGCWEISSSDWRHFMKALQDPTKFKKHLDSMRKTLVDTGEGSSYGRGLDFSRGKNGESIFGHDGNALGASCGIYILERRNRLPLTVIALSNFGQGRGGNVALELAKTLCGEDIEPLHEASVIQACFKEFAQSPDTVKGRELVQELLQGQGKKDYLMDVVQDLVGTGKIESAIKIVDLLCEAMPDDRAKSKWLQQFGIMLADADLTPFTQRQKSAYVQRGEQNLLFALEKSGNTDPNFIADTTNALMRLSAKG